MISFRKWTFFGVGLFGVCCFVGVFCGNQTASSDSKDFVSWKLRKNLSWDICDSVDQKADDFGRDFSGLLVRTCLVDSLVSKAGEAFWKQSDMLRSWRSSESVSRCAGVLTEAYKLCPGWAIHMIANRQNYLLTNYSRWNGKTGDINTAVTMLFVAPFGHCWDKLYQLTWAVFSSFHLLFNTSCSWLGVIPGESRILFLAKCIQWNKCQCRL